VSRCVGKGVIMLMTQALENATEQDVLLAVERFRNHYGKNLVRHTCLYPNVQETVEHFSGKPQAICSNKPVDFVEKILRRLKFHSPFQSIVGGDSLKSKKPDPEGLNSIMEKFHVSPGETLMVGDSPVDIETGKRAGATTVVVSYGNSPREALEAAGPDKIVDDIAELKKFYT